MDREIFLAQVQRALGGTATRGAAEVALSAVLRAIRAGLLEDGEVKLAGFGTFRMKQVRSRELLLPGSHTRMVLPERSVLRFSPSPRMRFAHNSARRTHYRLSNSSGISDDTGV